jgi:hypothetical protein
LVVVNETSSTPTGRPGTGECRRHVVVVHVVRRTMRANRGTFRATRVSAARSRAVVKWAQFGLPNSLPLHPAMKSSGSRPLMST